MLLNEFLKEHRKGVEQTRINQEQQVTIAELKSQLQSVIATIKKQSAQLQQIKAQLATNKADPRLVDIN